MTLLISIKTPNYTIMTADQKETHMFMGKELYNTKRNKIVKNSNFAITGNGYVPYLKEAKEILLTMDKVDLNKIPTILKEIKKNNKFDFCILIHYFEFDNDEKKLMNVYFSSHNNFKPEFVTDLGCIFFPSGMPEIITNENTRTFFTNIKEIISLHSKIDKEVLNIADSIQSEVKLISELSPYVSSSFDILIMDKGNKMHYIENIKSLN